MPYKILDRQIPGREFANGATFTSKKEIMEQLADYHSIDYEGVKEDDTEYKDIYEFLETLKSDKEKLEWLLEYGEWEIEKV